jgi:hypothetical protein
MWRITLGAVLDLDQSGNEKLGIALVGNAGLGSHFSSAFLRTRSH